MEVEVNFEREKISGVVAVDTYLFDAARRMGIEVEAECERRGACDSCAMRIKTGGEFLSDVTKAETEHLTAKRRKNGERLACQVKFERTGEISIMTHKKKVEKKPADEEKYDAYRKEFEELPLEKKVANLLHLEAVTLSETVSFVLNSPWLIVSKFMDVLAEFGLKMEDDAKKATRPSEHHEDDEAKKADEGKTVEDSDAAPSSTEPENKD